MIFLIGFGEFAIPPFLGNILTPSGILKSGQDALGFKPEVLPLFLRIALTCLLTFAVIAFRHFYRTLGVSLAQVPLIVFAIFSCAYVPCLFPGALLGLTYDRYLLPLFPFLVIFILSLFQRYVRPIPVIAWACLLLFAGYAIATTHDYFASLRARTSAAESLQRRGIPRSHISAGFEYDGWTQLQLTGKISAPGYRDQLRSNATDTFWLWSYTSALSPDFVIRNSKSFTTPALGFPAVPFTTWLPPFRRAAVVSRRSDLVKVSVTP